MHKIQFWHWGSLQHSSTTPNFISGVLLLRKKGEKWTDREGMIEGDRKKRRGEKRARERKTRKKRGREVREEKERK